MSCRRPSNKSSRLTLPLGPSNSYFFSTAIHGIRRRSAASASRERVKAFSFTSICCRAASHSCRDTIGGVFIATAPFACSLSLSLLVAISFLLSLLKQTETTHSENSSQFADAYRQNSSCGCGPRRPLLLCFRCMLGTYVPPLHGPVSRVYMWPRRFLSSLPLWRRALRLATFKQLPQA